LYLHLDNAPPDNSKWSTECIRTTKIKRIPHPAYSPDLAPSHPFLFGFLKEKLPEYQIPDRENLKRMIMHIFSEISEETLISVFAAWIERLEWVIKNNGEYFHK
jgi:hypothetical protein